MSPINMMPVEVSFKPAGKYWLASCRRLDITTQGETFERAHENLVEALTLFFESCIARGTLEDVLRQAGYSKARVQVVAQAARSYLASRPTQPENRCHA